MVPDCLHSWCWRRLEAGKYQAGGCPPSSHRSQCCWWRWAAGWTVGTGQVGTCVDNSLDTRHEAMIRETGERKKTCIKHNTATMQNKNAQGDITSLSNEDSVSPGGQHLKHWVCLWHPDRLTVRQVCRNKHSESDRHRHTHTHARRRKHTQTSSSWFNTRNSRHRPVHHGSALETADIDQFIMVQH